ncbi:unnamed protein product [Phytophthora lilii]|uniref:Unnamed protein product n=1 Tax=Phytophthora lilii TaxID=2077276 RepID=A0A9W6X1L0_9STRA|nr:unnamed protein product [Phytophthora lilii]
MISLRGNFLETINELAELAPNYVLLELSVRENPLRGLPAVMMSPASMVGRLDLQETNISALPTWTETQIVDVAYMHGTPYCTKAMANTRQLNVLCI